MGSGAVAGKGRFFGRLERALFVARPNRFTAVCRLGNRAVGAFLPNPGRMRELLLPGAVVYLEAAGGPGRRSSWTVAAVERDGRPVVVDTHRANAAARFLIEQGGVPGLEGARVLREEVPSGRSRFDFLLARGRRRVLLEVKSCTLFSRRVAMFPDAVTARGRRHVEELAALASAGLDTAILFLVQSPHPTWFLPEYHTDPGFARALLAARHAVRVLPVALSWTDDLALAPQARLLDVPWNVVEREGGDRGCYLAIFRLRRALRWRAGRAAGAFLPPGFHIYVGSAKRGLAARLARHAGGTGRPFWHVDRLRAAAKPRAFLPVRTADDIECDLASAVRGAADGEAAGFGCSDCRCSSHLFFMERDPLESARFHAVIQQVRMDRPVARLADRRTEAPAERRG